MTEEHEDDEIKLSNWEKFGAFITRNVLPAVIIPFSVMIGSGLFTLWDFNRDIKDIKQWQTGHLELHVERSRETKEFQGKTAADVDNVQLNLDKLAAIVANQGFQQASNVANIQRLQENQDKLGDTIAGLSSDVRIALEILKRLEDKENRRRSELIPGR